LESKDENNNSSKENSFFNFFKKIFKIQEVEIYDHEKEPTIKDYLEKRYKKQLQYYEKHASDNRVRFYISQIIIIAVSALIPIINTIPSDNSNINAIKMASSIFGFIIIVATGFLQLTKSQENWISYRSTAELLQSEYHLFKMKTGDYSDEKIGNDNQKREQLFVNRIETVILEEGKKFLSSHEKFEVGVKPKDDK
jgi:Protein of unknown function (DUF4231)